MNLHYVVHSKLTTIPGYHYLISQFMLLVDKETYIWMRFFSTIISGFTVFYFFKTTNIVELEEKNTKIKTLQFLFLPIIFPMLSLIYTDTLSLCLILLTTLFVFKKQYFLSGIFATLSIFVRQNNIIWLGYFFGMSYLSTFGFAIEFSFKKIITWMVKNVSYILGIAFFLGFVYLNNGVVIGDSDAHPASIYFGNLFFAIFLHFIIFLPIHIAKVGDIFSLLKKRIYLLIPIVLIFIFYMNYFIIDHPYNFGNLSLRDKILGFIIISETTKAVSFLPIAYTLLSFLATEYKLKYPVITYLFSALFLLPSWLVEQRYYIVPYTFYMISREIEVKKIKFEYLQIIYSIVISFIIFWGVVIDKWFL